MFNRKWWEEIAASFSFMSSSVPTFINTLILRFISIMGCSTPLWSGKKELGFLDLEMENRGQISFRMK